MLAWGHLPALRLLIFLILGILSAFTFEDSFSYVNNFFLYPIVFYGFALFIFNDNKSYFQHALKGLACCISFFLLGAGLYLAHKEVNLPDPRLEEVKCDSFLAVLDSDTGESAKYFRARVNVVKVYSGKESFASHGLVIVNFQKGALTQKLKHGDLVLIKGGPVRIKPPLNPLEFNYQRYLNLNNVYYQHFLKLNEVQLVKEAAVKDVSYYIATLRRNCVKILKDKIKEKDERAIALALILGVKNELGPEIIQAYSTSGAMHVLAVSGLHVGMIYGMILMVFGKLKELKYGKIIFACIALSALWMYGAVTGLPASVLRAVTMFSVIVISKTFNRQTNIYNTIAIAAVVLLIYNPSFLFAVGFQLSFLAVTGIVYLYPKIYYLVNPENKFLDKCWAITCLAISAQLATFPLCIYYFNQFPVYFWLSNLIVFPSAFFILGGGIGVLVLDFSSFISGHLAIVLEEGIRQLNQSIFALKFLPYYLIENLYINATQTVLLYCLMFFLVAFFHRKKLKYLFIVAFLVGCFSCFTIISQARDHFQKMIVFYNIPNHSAIDFIEGQSSTLWMDKKLQYLPSKVNYHIKPFKLSRGLWGKPTGHIPEYASEGFSIVAWNKKKILILNEPISNIKTSLPSCVDFLVLRNNCKQDLEMINKKMKVGLLIIDNSNNKFISDYLESEAQKFKLAFHNTSLKGAFIAEL